MKKFGYVRLFLAGLILILGFSFLPVEQVQGAENPVSIKSCKLTSGGRKLTVKAKVKKKTSQMGKKLYLLGLEPYHSESGKKSVTPLANVRAKKGTITFTVKYKSSMLYKKYAVAYKTGGKYQIVSDNSYITNPEALASYTGSGPKTSSKKGLQVEELSDSLEVGTKHAVINWTLSSILTSQGNGNAVPFKYRGVTYYLDGSVMAYNDSLVQAYNQGGAKVTIILLLPEDSSSATASMRFDGPVMAKFSSIDTGNKAGCRTFEAVMTYLAKRYGTKNNLVSGWILGNEVDSPYYWNYGGSKKQSSYIGNYARSFRICYNAVKSVSKNAKVYISLDHNWNTDPDGEGTRFFTTKSTLDSFYKKINKQGKITFQIAYHAYSQGLGDPIFWDDSNATNSVKSKIINFKNLNVLTDYVKKNYGKKYTIMLSEQSFNSTRGEVVQAACYAYAYYISETNSMIESFIYGREFDNDGEPGYLWGLCTKNHQKRLLWHVFQYIDTADSFTFTDPLVSSTNIKSWTKIKGFKKDKFKKMPSIRKVKAQITQAESTGTNEITVTWDKIKSGDGYEVLRKGPGNSDYVQVGWIRGNSTVSYKDRNVSPGNTYSYKIRLFKEAPVKGKPTQKKNIYGTISAGVSVSASTGQVVLDTKKCTVSGNKITIQWKKMEGVNGYEILRSTGKDSGYMPIGTSDSTKYVDKNTISGTTYYYKVRAFVTVNGKNLLGKESESVEKQALIGVTASIEGGKIVLRWSQWLNEGTYRLYCAREGEGFKKFKTVKAPGAGGYTWSGTRYTYKDGDANVEVGFEWGETYQFRVRAEFGDGKYSPYSNIVEVTPEQDLDSQELNDMPPEDTTEEPVEDTESTESTEPTGPAESTETTEPTENTNPTESTEPTESTGTTEPTESTESTEPTESKDSTETTESTETTVPTETTEPTGATESTEPTGPSDSAESTEETKTPASAESAGDPGPAESTESRGQAGAAESTENIGSVIIGGYYASYSSRTLL